MAQALRAAKSETDLDYLHALYLTMSNIRAPSALDVSAAVSADKSAATPARVTAMLILLSQFDNHLMPLLRKPWTDFTSQPVGDDCPFSPVVSADYTYRTQLPADSLTRITAVLDHIRKDAHDNEIVRDLARCMRTLLRTAAPIVVDPRSLSLAYVCGTRFQVRNRSDEWVTVSFRVEQTTDRGDVRVGPADHVTFTAREMGTMRIFYRGAVVAAERNGGIQCPT